jgi:hypothetical protein
VPYLRFSICLCCAPYWASGIFAVWLYRRLTGTLTLGQGVAVGLATGAIAGAIGLLLQLAGNINTLAMLNSYRSITPSGMNFDIPKDTEITFHCGIGLEFLISMLGGLIGGALLRTDKAGPPPSDEQLKPINL